LRTGIVTLPIAQDLHTAVLASVSCAVSYPVTCLRGGSRTIKLTLLFGQKIFVFELSQDPIIGLRQPHAPGALEALLGNP
jgi:hypothetical protein